MPMELTVTEVATLLGLSPRAVRGRLARGELPGVKRGAQWFVRQDSIPLTTAQQRAVQARADEIRAAVDQALPGRHARRLGDHVRTLWDLDAFRLGASLLFDLRSAACPGAPVAARHLERALQLLAEGAHLFERQAKLRALDLARARIGRASAALLLAGDPAQEVAADFVARLEGEVGPAIAGYARWASRLGRTRS